MTRSKAPLGSLSVEQFMARHWQRRPLLIRQAMPGFVSPVTPQQLFELAADDDVESRLIRHTGQRWQLQHGPFDADAIPPLSRRRWTLLLQGADLHLDVIHDLLARFRFISDARLDDLMISFATDGGGVGPHLDSYDVFLLQAHGRRRWRIGPTGYPRHEPALLDGVPLKILRDFQPTEEWLLEPGDMLYLPPGYAHDGAAVGECMTYSIGFRAPSRQEFLRAWLAECADAPGGKDDRYSDRGTSASAQPARIPAPLHQALSKWANDWRPAARDVDRFIGRFLTEPKAQVWFDTPPDGHDRRGFERLAAAGACRLDRRTRIAYRGRDLFINGEAYPGQASAPMRRLADRRSLSASDWQSAGETLRQHVYDWWATGWLRCDNPASL